MRIALLLLVLGLITFAGAVGLLVVQGGGFSAFRPALWWSMLRVSDPGYLAEDVASWGLITLSITLSAVGAAFLFGGVAAIMTQWLSTKLQVLARATRPVPWQDHVVVLGWTDRSEHVIRHLWEVNPEERVVVLIPEVTEEANAEVRRSLGLSSSKSNLVLRSGNSTQPEHLGRAACASARTVIMPEAEGTGAQAPQRGPRWLRRVHALSEALEGAERPPRVVIEIGDPDLEPVAKQLFPGARWVHGDAIVARRFAEALAGTEREGYAPDDVLDTLVLGYAGALEGMLRILEDQGIRKHRVVVLAPETSQESLSQWLNENPLEKVQVEQIVGDPIRPRSLAGIPLGQFDRFVILADRVSLDAVHADERSVAAALALGARLDEVPENAKALLEILDPVSTQIVGYPRLISVVTPYEVAMGLAQAAVE